jgi:hypothetical protein
VTRRSAVRCLSGLATSALLPAIHSQDGPTVLHIGGGAIEVNFRSNEFDLPREAMLDWISTGARAVSTYFGRFPVPQARLEIVMAGARRGGGGRGGGARVSGVTFAEGGARSRLTVGQHVTVQDLQRDWVLTHELVHYGFPSMDEDHHWIEEGSATYIEPIARAAVGNLPVTQVWGDMVRDMPQGLPTTGDEGLDHTHTWGRTYWGGALFCLLGDVEIRRKSHNKKGLVDALRAINRAGGNIESDWPLERALHFGDKATGGKALMTLYGQMAAKPMPVDLADLWKQLGVRREGGQVAFDSTAPLAQVRAAISS